MSFRELMPSEIRPELTEMVGREVWYMGHYPYPGRRVIKINRVTGYLCHWGARPTVYYALYYTDDFGKEEELLVTVEKGKVIFAGSVLELVIEPEQQELF